MMGVPGFASGPSSQGASTRGRGFGYQRRAVATHGFMCDGEQENWVVDEPTTTGVA